MSYATPQNIINRYPNRDLVQLTNEDPTVTTINTAALQQALDDASAEIDGYLGGRFTLPLTDVPVVLNRLACDVAIYRLQSLRPIHDLADAKAKYEKAITFLQEVSDGKRTLGLSTNSQEPADAASPAVVMDQNFGGDPSLPQRVFRRSTLKDF